MTRRRQHERSTVARRSSAPAPEPVGKVSQSKRQAMAATAAAPAPDRSAEVRTVLPVAGMTCRTCEGRIERTIARLPGIVAVSASAPRGRVEVISNGRASRLKLVRAIEAAGYEVGSPAWISTNPAVWGSAGLGLALVVALAVVVTQTGLSDIASGAGSLSRGGIVVALLLGLAAGVSTCMAMAGGLVLALSATFASSRQGSPLGPLERFRPSLSFVGGRIAGYGAFGALLGAVGATLTPPPIVTAAMMIAVALVMTVLGMRLTGLSPRVAAWSPTLPAVLGRRVGSQGQRGGGAYSDTRAAALGAASFFLPCGFTQAVQIYALSTGSPVTAGLITATFALGTAPGLLALAGLPSIVPSGFRPGLLRLVGMVVLAFALVNGTGGLRLAGIEIPPPVAAAAADEGEDQFAPLSDVSTDAPADATQSPAENGTQGPTQGPSPDPTRNPTPSASARVLAQNNLHTYQHASGYSPRNARIRAGIPTIWTIDSDTDATCAAYIVIPSLDMQFALQTGRNTVRLPALPAGVVQYMCGMGMYTASITVVAW